MIPEAAVEAAARSMAANGFYENWEQAPHALRRLFIRDAEVALEAAAPHMLADAWDAALQEADDQGYLYGHQTNLLKMSNPYRTTP